MPGPVSDSSRGLSDDTPYVPAWCYEASRPHICTNCGCGENYHNDSGKCLRYWTCGCIEYAGIVRD